MLSYPFRVGPDGGVATVEGDSEQADTEEVAVLLLTVRGERPLLIGYGIEDPTFAGIRAPEVMSAISRWVPAVTVTGVSVQAEGVTTQRATVSLA